MIYIFGYGSLLYAKGINGRGMKRIYTDDDLIPCFLSGYERSWNAVHCGTRYLGIYPNPTSSINGVIFPIDACDIDPFRESECSSVTNPKPTYNIVDVAAQIKTIPSIADTNTIFTCVTANPSQKGTIHPSYLRHINDALTVRGQQFANNFWLTIVSTDPWARRQHIVNSTLTPI
jgi:hypothetical protein